MILKEIKILMLLNLLCASASMAFLSVIGPIIRALGMQEYQAGLMVSIGGILWVISSRFWGRKSDIIGRKPVLIIGALGIAVGYLGNGIFIDYALSSLPYVWISFFALLFLRGSVSVFYSALTPASNALVADLIEPEKRTSYIAKLAAANGFGMIFGPALGGYLANYGLSTPLYAFALLPFIATLLLYFKLPFKKPHSSDEKPMIKLTDKRLRMPSFAIFVAMFVVSTTQIILGFYLIDSFGFDNIKASTYTGYILAVVGVVFIASQIFVSKVKAKPDTLLFYGSLMGIFGYILAVSFNSLITLTAGISIGTFGLGLIFPASQTLAVNLVQKHEQGASAGTISAAQGIGMVTAPLVGTFLYGFNIKLPFVFCILIFGILSLILFSNKIIPNKTTQA